MGIFKKMKVVTVVSLLAIASGFSTPLLAEAVEQKVRIEVAHDDDNYGDIFVDTDKSFAIYKEWLALTRPAPGPNGERAAGRSPPRVSAPTC